MRQGVQPYALEMPYTFVIDKTAGIVRETWTGAVDLKQLEQSSAEEWAHPDFSARYNLISDFRDAEAQVSVDDVLKFASWFGTANTPRKHAIVVRRETGLELASIFSMIRDTESHQKSETRLFFSYQQAENWLLES